MSSRPQRILLGLAAAAVGLGVLGAAPRIALTGAKPPSPGATGVWSPVFAWPIVAVNAGVLPNGKLLVFPRDTAGQAKLYDPAATSFAAVPITRTDLFCTGHANLGDGRILLAGGHIADGVGLAHTNLFQPSNGTWVAGPNMSAGRWYPTVTALASGDALVVSGQIDDTDGVNRLPEVFRMRTNTLRALADAQYTLPLYPFMHLAPNGKVFDAGPNQATLYFDVHGGGTLTSVANRQFGYRDYGSSVMYEPGKVLVVGGHDPPTNTAEVIDLNAPMPAWRYTAPMRYARRMANASILPDGKVLVTGGTASPGFNTAAESVFAAELWDPATETWTTLASNRERRLYHSTALLLPDGRVLSAGGGQPFANDEEADHKTAEFFTPPYLLQGKRPAILDAPATVVYGERFYVTTPDAASLAKVTWIRLPSTTHALDMNQRFNRLDFSVEDDGLLVTAPQSATLCPPGDYMMFVLNSTGVPSVARTIRIGFDAGLAPVAPTALTATPARTSIALKWSDAGWNEDGYRVERSSNGGTSWIQVASPGNDDTRFTNTGLTRNRTYLYRVRAFNAAGASAWSDILSVTTLP